MIEIRNSLLRDWLRQCPIREAEAWFDLIAPKNVLAGSDSARNTNSIMVQIGRRRVVEDILDAVRGEKEQREPQPFTPLASELAGKITK